jgi:hypothetical protein
MSATIENLHPAPADVRNPRHAAVARGYSGPERRRSATATAHWLALMLEEVGHGMLLLSDGVTEAHDMASDLFGKDRVLAALGTQADPAAAIAALLRDVAGFVREAPPADDVTVLAVRYAG